ncbi:MAG: GAF domain-containing sensor histidine kinase [Actinobacteria bacterium]|nr:GAF domain-containing sensor histidine kinase [Actinomycetota bacterium]
MHVSGGEGKGATGGGAGNRTSIPEILAGRSKEYFSRFDSIQAYMDAVLRDLEAAGGLDSVGIRLKDEYDNLPFVAHRGYPDKFIREENWLRVDRDDCVCTRIARSTTCECDTTGITRGGSFSVDNFPAFLESLQEEDKCRYRHGCRDAGFRSITVIPLVFRHETIGIIHLAKREDERRQGGAALEAMEAAAPLVAEALYHYRLEERLRRSNDLLRTINSLLELSLSEMSLDEIISRSLDLVLSIPWLSIESRGAVFMVEDEPDLLIMKAERGLEEEVRRQCAMVPFGNCLCGRAALRREVLISDHLDREHETRYSGIYDHKHYCVPILSPSGEVLGVINLYRGKGHRKSEEELDFLRSVSRALAGIIMRRRFEQELARSEAQMRDFMVLAAHELRHPITIISGYAHLLQNYHDRIHDGDLPEILSSIQASTRRLTRIVDELLDVSRVESRPSHLVKSEVELRSLAESAVDEVRRLGHQRDIVIVSPGKDIRLQANEDMLMTAVFELLDNAVKFSPASTTIEVIVREEGGNGYVSVIDRGRGVPSAFRENIFERFTQVEDVLHHSTPGLGLGLYMARKIAEEHGGRLSYEPRDGGGSIFTITVPLA